jgi:transposase-like protein
MARPTKLTEEKIEILCRAMSIGATRKVAAAAVGIHVGTLFAWLSRGKNARRNSIYREFHDRFKKAEAMCCLGDLSIITRAAQQDWRAAAWRLKTRYGFVDNQTEDKIVEIIDPENISVSQLLSELKATEEIIQNIKGPVIDVEEE